MWPEPIRLESARVVLEPLSHDRHDELVDADRDGELWKLWYTTIPAPEKMRAEIERRLGLMAQQSMLPFAIIDRSSGKAAGMTTYMHIDAANRRVEIGSTWLRKSLQRSGVNLECKQLLLNYAFENLQCIAVEFRTHFFNRQSRRAIEELGAKLDGVLRSHSIAPNGTLRDACVYSIIASEWPTVKAHLAARLSR